MIPVNPQIAGWVLAGLLVGTWLLLLHFRRVKPGFTVAAFKVLPTALTVVFVLVALFSRWGWKWAFLHDWFVRAPVLEGTWTGEIHSTWKDGKGRTIRPIAAKLSVRQTLWRTSCTMETNEMTSRSLAASFFSDPDSGEVRLTYSYLSVPVATVRDRSPITMGAAVLEWSGAKPQVVRGNYWTDRRTTGRLEFRRTGDGVGVWKTGDRASRSGLP
jgi:hypothetical protein